MTLKQIRTSLGWTQERMARELGLSLRSYCRNEKSGPSEPVMRLAQFLGKYSQPERQMQSPTTSSSSA